MATGIEIAALVLGAFPLVISSLKHYRIGIETFVRWYKSEREAASLRRHLIAERVVFHSACELLLSALVPSKAVDGLIVALIQN